MCLIVLKAKGILLEKEVLENGFNNNSHGAGFCYAENGEINIIKGFFDFESFWAAYKPFRHKELLIHFRLATSGQKDIFNCHPWAINGHFALVHNGIFDVESTKEMSDTGHFVKSYLENLFTKYPDFWRDGKELIELAIGSHNKIAILRNDGAIEIYNQSEWIFDKELGCWFSNESYKKSYFSSFSVPNFRFNNRNVGKEEFWLDDRLNERTKKSRKNDGNFEEQFEDEISKELQIEELMNDGYSFEYASYIINGEK